MTKCLANEQVPICGDVSSVDSVAGPAFSSNFNMLASLGQVIWYGTAAGLPPENLLEPLNAHFVKSIQNQICPGSLLIKLFRNQGKKILYPVS